ncbi:MAG: SLBB domain-containing protein [Bacteroidota bacterium]
MDDLSDDQLRALMGRAASSGYSEQEIYTLAEQRGYSAVEIIKLRERVRALKSQETVASAPAEVMQDPPQGTRRRPKDSVRIAPLQYFGYDFFNANNTELSFEPNLYVPPTDDYVLGPRDKFAVYLYGASEKNQGVEVNASGFVVLDNIGPIFVSGLTFGEARDRIKMRLGKYYEDLLSRNPQTFLEISMSQVRTINVNLVGEVRTPGTYSVNGFTTVFNALYAGGGPTKNGTLRAIKVIRNGEPVATVDYYDFLMSGNTKSNITLKDDDIILVGSHLGRVRVFGEVNRPAIYEIEEGESVEDILSYAGGFTSEAYRDRIGLTRKNGVDKSVADVFASQYQVFRLDDGDELFVGKILDRYTNRVSIKGAVYRPGQYALEEGLTLSKLLNRADGLTGDAFTGRALITRTKPDLSTETISVALDELLSSGLGDIPLQREDVIQVLSTYDLQEELFVQISGEVNRPGSYRYSANMNVTDLLFLAQGFKESAATGNVEVSSRPDNQNRGNLAEIRILSVSKDLELVSEDQDLMLKPFDHVFVRRNPDYFEEKTIQITGEVQFPGKYALVSEEERISDIIGRAGGLLGSAYVPGANIIRETEYFRVENDVLKRQEYLLATLQSMDSTNLTEADIKFIEEVFQELDNAGLQPIEENEGLASAAKRARLIELAQRNPFLGGLDLKRSESIALDLASILNSPKGAEDFFLESGDIINIPRELKTIRLRGKVLYPNAVRYEPRRSLKHFIDKAGGFDTRAKKSKTYVVYANGDVSRTSSFLFFRSYPRPEPGSEVIIPAKPPKIPLKPGEVVAITGGLATIGLIVTQLIQVVNSDNN